jgi:CheY-like chemotaxis protein
MDLDVRQAERMTHYRVLIVDDQRDARLLLRAGLATLNLNLEVIDVPSAEEAMLVLSNTPIDLLVADVRLPGMSGLELKKHASRRNPETKLILITGVADPDIQRQVAEAGASAYFYKPISITEFLTASQACLESIPALADQPVPLKTPAARPEEGLSRELSDFSKKVEAAGAVIFDAQGQILAQAGEWSLPARPADLIAGVIELRGAANKIPALSSDESSQSLSVFKGKEYDLFISYLTSQTALLFAVRSGLQASKVAEVLDATQRFQEVVEALLIAPVPDAVVVISAPESAAEEEITLAIETTAEPPDIPLDELVLRVETTRFDPGDVDAFWEKMAESEMQDIRLKSDSITYEQAQLLGLDIEGNKEE